jgi:hypothetical protein
MRRAAVLSAAFAVIYVVVSWGSPIHRNDSGSYFDWNARLIGLPRRIYTVPSAFLLVGRNEHAIVVLHIVVGVTGWLALVWAVRTSLRTPWLRVVVPTLVGLLALSDLVTAWNRQVLSEGLSIGLLPWLVAASILVLGEPTRRNVLLWLVACSAWAYTRPTHLFVTLALLGVVALVVAVRRPVGLGVVAAGLAVVVVVGLPYLLDTKGNVSEFNEGAIVVDRVLVDPDLAAWFADHGMPTSDEVDAEAGQFAFAASAAFDDPELRRWNQDHFLPTYVGYLARHPGWAVAEPLGEAEVLSPDGDDPLDDLVSSGWTLALLAGAAAVLLGWALVEGVPRSPLLLVAAGLVAGAVIELYANWHLSATELIRLNATAAVALRLGLLLAVGWLLDQRVQGAAASGSMS